MTRDQGFQFPSVWNYLSRRSGFRWYWNYPPSYSDLSTERCQREYRKTPPRLHSLRTLFGRDECEGRFVAEGRRSGTSRVSRTPSPPSPASGTLSRQTSTDDVPFSSGSQSFGSPPVTSWWNGFPPWGRVFQDSCTDGSLSDLGVGGNSTPSTTEYLHYVS